MPESRHTQRRLLAVLAFLVAALLVVELVVRLVTYLSWRAPLKEFPELFEAYARTAKVMRVLHPGVAFEEPERWPARVPQPGSEGEVDWTTYGEFPRAGFPKPPASDEPCAGVVRIAFVGGSTTNFGYPQRVGARMAAHFGEGRVEVVNMGVPVSWSSTSLVLMERYLPLWRPHIVVVHHGINDILFARFKNLALWYRERPHETSFSALVGVNPRSRGLLRLMFPSAVEHPPVEIFDPSSAFLADYWEMSRLVWKLGSEIFVTTFPAPDVPRLSEEEQRYFRTEVEYLWPLAVDADTYLQNNRRRNVHMFEFAARAGADLIDAARFLTGGRDVFDTICHLVEEGDERLADEVFRALVPRVEALLAVGAPLPHEPRPSPAAAELGGRPPTEHPRDGSCLQGPCPDGACLVPGGEAVCGFDAEQIGEAVRVLRKATGWADPQWFTDDGPARRVTLSPFCIDRTEVTEAQRQRCVMAGVCPPYVPRETALDTPAPMPTVLDAQRFCAWAGGRLPTDCELDAAARGADNRANPWGGPWRGEEANYCRECFGRPVPGLRESTRAGRGVPAPPGSFSGVSPFGLIDAAGNMWEWTLDCFDFESHEMLEEGVRDPLFWKADECQHALRGGSFRSTPGILCRRMPDGGADVLPDSRGVRCAYDFGTRHTILPDSAGRSHRGSSVNARPAPSGSPQSRVLESPPSR